MKISYCPLDKKAKIAVVEVIVDEPVRGKLYIIYKLGNSKKKGVSQKR